MCHTFANHFLFTRCFPYQMPIAVDHSPFSQGFIDDDDFVPIILYQRNKVFFNLFYNKANLIELHSKSWT